MTIFWYNGTCIMVRGNGYFHSGIRTIQLDDLLRCCSRNVTDRKVHWREFIRSLLWLSSGTTSMSNIEVKCVFCNSRLDNWLPCDEFSRGYLMGRPSLVFHGWPWSINQWPWLTMSDHGPTFSDHGDRGQLWSLTMVDDGIWWVTMVVHSQPSNTMKTR